MDKYRYNNLAIVLEEKEVSNKELAEGVGVSENTVSRWRNNLMQPGIPKLFQIADYLEVNVKDLLRDNEGAPKG